MKMEHAQLNYLAILGALFLAIDQALGCVCPQPQNPHPQQQVCRADFVIRGEVIKKEGLATNDDSSLGLSEFDYSSSDFFDFGSTEITYTVKVKRIYKGEEFMPESGKKIVHITALAYCDPNLKEGGRYVISADALDNSEGFKLRTDNCQWNVEWSTITQGQRQGLKHFYEKYCQKCEIEEGIQFMPNINGPENSMVKSTRCFYEGGACEKLHSSCIRKSTGHCGWTTNSNYRSCKLRELERASR